MGSKNKKRYVVTALTALVVFSVLSAGSTGKSSEVLISDLRGPVFIEGEKNVPWEPLEKTGVNPCTGYKTGERGEAEFLFGDGSVLRFGPRSRFEIRDHITAEGVSQFVSLLRGVVLVERSRAPKGASYLLGPVCFSSGCLTSDEGSFIIHVQGEGKRSDIISLRGVGTVYFSKGRTDLTARTGELLTLHDNGQWEDSRPYSEEHLPEIYPWMKREWFERQRLLGQLYLKKVSDILAGKKIKKILLLDFVYTGDRTPAWDVSRFVTAFLERSIENIKDLQVFRSDLGRGSPMRLGVENNADMVVYGNVEKFEITNSALYIDSEKRYQKAHRADLQLELKMWSVRDSAFTVSRRYVFSEYGDLNFSIDSLRNAPLAMENLRLRQSPLWKAMEIFSSQVERVL